MTMIFLLSLQRSPYFHAEAMPAPNMQRRYTVKLPRIGEGDFPGMPHTIRHLVEGEGRFRK